MRNLEFKPGAFDDLTYWVRKDRKKAMRILQLLATLVEAYEEKHYPIPPPHPIEAILHEMESQGLSRRDLEPSIGSRARVSEILNRKRPLSLNMIRKLQRHLKLSADILIQPYDLV